MIARKPRAARRPPVPAVASLAAVAFVAVALSACLIACFVVPSLVALYPALLPASWVDLPVGKILRAARFTLTQAFLSSLIAVLVGLPAAALVARRDFPGRRVLLATALVPLCVPPIIIALAFVLFYGRQGYLNVVIMWATGAEKPPVTFLYSLGGLVLVHGLYNFPVVMRTVSRVWERLPASEEEAATLLGAGKARLFATITLPRLSGAIVSAASLVFLYCFFSFVIVLLFTGVGGTTLEVELYQAARNTLDVRLASAIALVETLMAIGIVILYRKLDSGIASGLGPARSRGPLTRGKERTLATLYLIALTVFFFCPLASVAARSITPSLSAWRFLLSRDSFASALFSTVWVALVSASLATVTACTVAAFKGRRGSSFVKVLAFLPLAVSPVMLAYGWNSLHIRGTPLVLAAAQASLSWPFAWTQVRASLDRVSESVHDAAALLSPRALDSVFRIRLPLAARGIASGFALAFAISAGDATLPITLAVPGFENLSLLLYRLAGSYRFAEAAACATVLAGISALVIMADERGGARGTV